MSLRAIFPENQCRSVPIVPIRPVNFARSAAAAGVRVGATLEIGTIGTDRHCPDPMGRNRK